MKRVTLVLCTFIIYALGTCAADAQQLLAPEPQTGTIIGTVVDVQEDLIPGASIVLDGPVSSDRRTVVANDNGFFTIDNLKPGIPYHITINATGFATWISPILTLKPGQYLDLSSIKLKIEVAVTTVAVVPDSVQLATQQLEVEEKQRVLGIIPNFYTVYDPNAVALTTKLKYRLALRVTTDPITILGSAFIAGIDQAADTPSYQQGWKGYGQRFGANYANGLTDIMIGGAILPSILHQDPRYFYQGTGTTKSRLIHALSTPFICKGDNGRWQPNFSSLGGYLGSGAIANTYYPDKDRGPGLVFGTFGIDVAASMADGVIQEFLLRRLTPSAKNRSDLSVISSDTAAGH